MINIDLVQMKQGLDLLLNTKISNKFIDDLYEKLFLSNQVIFNTIIKKLEEDNGNNEYLIKNLINIKDFLIKVKEKNLNMESYNDTKLENILTMDFKDIEEKVSNVITYKNLKVRHLVDGNEKYAVNAGSLIVALKTNEYYQVI